MKRLVNIGLLMTLVPISSLAWDTPTMGWSSWNSFGHRINEEIIRSQADAMVSTGLLDAGFKYVNLDDGAWCGRDETGHLRIHPQRFPNGLKDLVAYIHSLGLKAGTYSDAGHNTCASFYGGDTDGVGTGLYEHDLEDADFMFNELGFDFIKVDFCGGDAPQNSEHLDLDERQRYTEISEAIKATGRTDVRYNVCRWAYPGTWVEDVATSWRMSQDIYDGWESVKDIIHQNLYLSAYATKGRFNDMDMLEVGRSMGEEEDKTHFGMWCMMSSPLLIGCDLRYIKPKTLELLTNDELVALNQDPLALQCQVVKRDKGGYILVKDVDQLHSTTRAIALYNPTDTPLEMTVDFYDLDLDGEVVMRDLFERMDIGVFSGSFNVKVPPHATRIYRASAEHRLERKVYEGETGRIAAYQELENNQVVKSGVYEEVDYCSGGAKVGWLGAREDNSLSWHDVWSEEGGAYDMTLYFITGADRNIKVDVNGKTVDELTVNSGGWDVVGSVSLKVSLEKGENIITLSNASDWMPDIDCMTLVKEGNLDLLRHRHQTAYATLSETDLSSLPEVMALHLSGLLEKESVPEETREGYERSIDAISLIKTEIERALTLYEEYIKVRNTADENVAASESTDALSKLTSSLAEIDSRVASSIVSSDYSDSRAEIERIMRDYLTDGDAKVKKGESWNLTSLISNPSFHNDSYGWDEQPVYGSHVAEFWNRSFATFQKLQGLREGNYLVGVQGLYRVSGNDGGVNFRGGNEEIPAMLVANDEEIPLMSLYAHPLSETPDLESRLSGTHVLRGYVNSMYGAEQAFKEGLYVNQLPVKVNDGNLRIGLKCDSRKDDCWCCFDNFSLRYYGESDAAVDFVEGGSEERYDIYTVTGICIQTGADAEDIQGLPSGLYIINGKKIAIIK